MNNGVLGMVHQWQKLFYGQRYSYTEINRATDFVKLAEAFGAVGMRLTDEVRYTLPFPGHLPAAGHALWIV
jgi:acetolactate synthase-1/2/3 large subunit